MEAQISHPTAALISQTSEYALRAVVFLAQRENGPAAAQDIAAATKVPVGYLQKILRVLSRAGMLNAQRGVGGGFSLAKPPTAISVLDVLTATDTDISRIARCPLGIKGHTRLCPLHRLLDEQIAGVRSAFASTTVAELVSQGGGRRGLCGDAAGQGLTVRGVVTKRRGGAHRSRPT